MRSACWNSALSAGPTVASSCAREQRVAYLTEDLALTEDHRVHAGGDAEQVRHGGLVEVDVDVPHELVAAEIGVLRQQARHLLDGSVEALGLDVDLDAVAGRDDDRLGDERASRAPAATA